MLKKVVYIGCIYTGIKIKNILVKIDKTFLKKYEFLKGLVKFYFLAYLRPSFIPSLKALSLSLVIISTTLWL